MRVESSTVDQVRKRFEMNKKKLEEKKKDYDIEQRMRELKEEVSSCKSNLSVFVKSKYLNFVKCLTPSIVRSLSGNFG